MITANDIVKANEVLKNVVERTPLDFDRYLSEKYGATIYIKKENMQKVRSFKLRGAYYAIHQLSDEDKARGVVCASAGNHAQGVAYTCKRDEDSGNHLYASNNTSPKNWSGPFLWWQVCNNQIGGRYL